MARTKVNNEYFHTGWLLAFKVDPNVVVNEPLPFRYGNVKKGEFKGSQIIQGWLNIDATKVIKTDEELDMKVKYKFLETKERQNVMVARIPVTLENGIYDPVFGLPFPGNPNDARSIDFVSVKPNTEYQFNLLGVSPVERTFNPKGTFGSVASTTGGDLPQFNVNNVTSKGTFGNSGSTTGGDLPSAGNVFGDQYICNLNDFFSTEASNIFDINDTATFTDPGWVKNTVVVEVNDGYTCDTNNFDSDVAGITYQVGEVAVFNSSFIWSVISGSNFINVLQFDENDQTTAAVDFIDYNQLFITQIDTVKVKVWASDILVDSSDVPITDYQIGEQVLKYVFGAEVLNIQVETIENQKYGIIRGRTDTNVTVLQLS
jgi:hypothetical protein